MLVASSAGTITALIDCRLAGADAHWPVLAPDDGERVGDR